MFHQVNSRFTKYEPYYRSIILVACDIIVAGVQYLKNSFAIFVCIFHDFREIYPVWGDWFSLESTPSQGDSGKLNHVNAHVQSGYHRVTSFLQSLPCFGALMLLYRIKEDVLRSFPLSPCEALYFFLCAFLGYKWPRLPPILLQWLPFWVVWINIM